MNVTTVVKCYFVHNEHHSVETLSRSTQIRKSLEMHVLSERKILKVMFVLEILHITLLIFMLKEQDTKIRKPSSIQQIKCPS